MKNIQCVEMGKYEVSSTVLCAPRPEPQCLRGPAFGLDMMDTFLLSTLHAAIAVTTFVGELRVPPLFRTSDRCEMLNFALVCRWTHGTTRPTLSRMPAWRSCMCANSA